MRVYNRGVAGAVTFEKRVQFDQSVSMTMGSRLALGGINGLVDEITTNTTMLTYPVMSIFGNSRLNTSLHLQTTSAFTNDGPQIRFISSRGAMAMTVDPGSGILTFGPMDEGQPEQVDTGRGMSISEEGLVKIQREVLLGFSSDDSNVEYETKIYSNLRAAKTAIFGKQVVIGRDNWVDDTIDTSDSGTYDTLIVANPTAANSNKASILISQAAKGPGQYAELKFVATDTSDNTFKHFIRTETGPAAGMQIGNTDTSTGVDTYYATFDASGNFTVSKDAMMVGALGVLGTSTFFGPVILGDATSDDITLNGYLASAIIPKTDNTYDLGSSTQEFKDLYIDGEAHIDTLDVDINASIGGTLSVVGATVLGELTADTFRNTQGASFDAQAIFSQKIGIGYAYGTETGTWAEQLKITNPDGLNNVILKLEQTTAELDSTLILHAISSSGANRQWGIKHEGNEQDLIIGIANANNNIAAQAIYMKFERLTGLTLFESPVLIEDNNDFYIRGGDLKVYNDTSGTEPIFTAEPTVKKVAIGINAALTEAFTTTNGQQGDYDLVIASKDTSFKNANLAFVTDHSAVQKEFEIELNHDSNIVSFWSHTAAQKLINKDSIGRIRSTFDQDTGSLTVKTLTLEGSLNLQAGEWADPALVIPQAEFVKFDGTYQTSTLQAHTASGGYFGIYNNVEPYSFADENDTTGTKENAAHAFTGIVLDTTQTNYGGQIHFYTGRNDGNTAITNKNTELAMQLQSTSGGSKSITMYGTLNIVDLDGSQANIITNGSAQSTILNLSGDTIDYIDATLTGKLTADHVVTQTFEAGGIFAASGVGVVSITDRADINAPSADSILAFHHGDGGGQAIVFSQISNTLAFKRTDHNSFNINYTTSPDLLTVNYAAAEPSVEIGGKLVASSGLFTGDIDVSTGTITSSLTRTGEIEIYGPTVTEDLTVNSVANVDSMNVVTSLNLENSTVNLNPATKFLTTVSGVLRDAYLVASSGTSYYIGQGELGLATDNYPGVELMIAPPEPTIVTNFRLTDVNPHTDMYQNKSRAILEWGYKTIVGAAGADTTIGGTTYPTFQSTSNTGGDAIDLTDGAGSQKVSGRFLRFPSGKKHMIVAWNNSSKIFTLAITYDAESSTIADPAKMVDSGTGYTLNVLKQVEGGVSYQPYQAFNLDSTYIDTPRYEMELALAGNYYFGMTTTDGTKSSENILMSSGVFDPDSSAGGQGLSAYSAPYTNNLPYLSNLPSLPDHLSLNATQYGFEVTINGWGSEIGEGDVNQIAHQFEIGYTTQTAFDWNAETTSRTIIPFNSANSAPIANIYDSATYTVAVRPLQNQQVVYDEDTNGIIKKSILAGGGGVPPNMQVVVDYPFALTAYSGVYTGQGNSNTYTQATISGMTFYADSITGPVTVGFNEFAPQNNFTLISSPQLETTGQTIINNNQFDGNDSGQGTIDLIIDGFVASEFQGSSIDFTIGATEESRKILETQLEADFILRKIVVDVDWASNVSGADPGIIRVYPKGNTSAGDQIQITAAAGLFTQAIDLTINASVEPNRTIIIDGFDGSALPNNNWSISGRIWVYGQTYDSNSNQNAQGGGVG